MKWLVLAVAVVAFPAWADDMRSYAVLSTATQVFDPAASGSTYRKSLKVINRSAAAIYCSPESDVTTNTGDVIAAGASLPYPAVPIWCIAASSQAGTGTDRTIVWESDA